LCLLSTFEAIIVFWFSNLKINSGSKWEVSTLEVKDSKYFSKYKRKLRKNINFYTKPVFEKWNTRKCYQIL